MVQCVWHGDWKQKTFFKWSGNLKSSPNCSGVYKTVLLPFLPNDYTLLIGCVLFVLPNGIRKGTSILFSIFLCMIFQLFWSEPWGMKFRLYFLVRTEDQAHYKAVAVVLRPGGVVQRWPCPVVAINRGLQHYFFLNALYVLVITGEIFSNYPLVM